MSYPVCSIYSRRHPSECFRKTGGFFWCGSKDPLVRDCPQQGSGSGKEPATGDANSVQRS